jgi:U3 small nucleolar RNA-associated protein 14
MPGRQAHGRSLLPGGNAKPKRQNDGTAKSRSKSRAKALNAFTLAEEAVPERRARGVRTRDLEPSPEPQPKKRGHDDDDDDDEDEAVEIDTRRKRPRNGDDASERYDDPDMEMEEDSEGNEWHVGFGKDDEDSEIDSDEAFGEGDDEAFEGYAFKGSNSKSKGNKKKGKKQQDSDDEEDEEEEGDDDDDLSSLGSDAIDLATALDQFSESEDDEAGDTASSGSEEDDSDDEPSGTSESDDDDEDTADKDALKALISGFAGDDDEDAGDAKSSGKAKIALKDLGLFGVKDPHMKKSLKLMNKEEKATKPGTAKKLDIPLAKRAQDKLLRTAAFDKASETLDRWQDTVKSNRRADHLFFPLAQNAHDAGLNKDELLPLTAKTAGTELEQTIMAIMEESGLSKSTKTKMDKKLDAMEEAKDPSVSREELKEIWNQRRRERELASRELARSKRIKKIKSKAYRRIHRKERLGEEEANFEAMKAAGEIDSEEEREMQDRRRAMERMGSKHKESKWAKMGSKAGRAAWDDDFRAGLTDMARRDEELRKRIEGRTGDGTEEDDDEDDDVDSDVDGRDRLLQELDRANVDDAEPKSGLMAMKFMQRGEEALKKANDELVAQIRKDLASDAEDDDDEEEEQPDVGRRQYGANKAVDAAKATRSRPTRQEKSDGFVIDTRPSGLTSGLNATQTSALGVAGAWSSGQPSRKSKKGVKAPNVEELDLSSAAILATGPKSSSKRTAQANGTKTKLQPAGQDDDSVSEDEDTIHLPMAIRDTELIKRAFAGEDVVVEFEKEKAVVAEEDDDKEIDNTLPGWGNWVGDGVSARDRKKHTGRFITKVEGVKKQNRKDYKLEKVIVNEKRVRKVSTFGRCSHQVCLCSY